MNEAVEDGVGIGRIANDFMPTVDGKLRGDHGGAAPIAVFKDFKEIMPGGGIERLQSPVIQDEKIGAAQVAQKTRMTSIAARQGMVFAGDLGRRIFQHPFSWKALGIDVRGRSSTLRINYRTSHQIRSQADRLLPSTVSDVDGLAENRRGTVSVFDGPPPDVVLHASVNEERDGVGQWLAARLGEGIEPRLIGVFVRSERELSRARGAVKAAGAKSAELDGRTEPEPGSVAIGTMHLAKGLEFKAVAVMACDDEVLPSQERIEAVTDESDLEEVYDTERHLLYVACTRARDHLLVSGVVPGSEYLKDLKPAANG